MFRATSPQNPAKAQKLGHRTYPQLNPQIPIDTNLYTNPNIASIHNMQSKINDITLQAAVNNLLKTNQQLTQKLNVEKEKNFDLLELKRRLQDDIGRLEFQLDRIGTHENIQYKEIQIKRNQTNYENVRLKAELDKSTEENKHLRDQNRKWKNQCQSIIKQKEDLVNQNVILLNQIADLKSKLTKITYHNKQYEKKLVALLQRSQAQKNTNTQDFISMRSIDQINVNQMANRKIQLNNPSILLPAEVQKIPTPSNYQAKKGQYFHRQQMSTNPSQNKIIMSPIVFKSGRNQQKIYHQFYQNNLLSPKHIKNKNLERNLQLMSPSRQVIYSSNSPNHINNLSSRYFQSRINSPSVQSYGNRQSPIIDETRFSQQQQIFKNKNQNQVIAESQNNDQFLQTYQKTQLKDQVAKIRNQIVTDLIDQYYKRAIASAQRQKNNSLKNFIKQLQPKVETFYHMVINYLQARSMVVQNCPTLRVKWQANNPLTNNVLSVSLANNRSQLAFQNSINLSKIYQSIKQNARRQKTVAGQYLALFRFLTLLSKVEEDVDPLLIDCIKHSTLKQVYRIKAAKDGKTLGNDVQ